MFNIIAAAFSAASAASSFVEGRKASKRAEAAGDLNRVTSLVNARLEGERVRITAQAGKYQSLISSEDLKVNELIVRANQRKARLEGDLEANRAMLERDRIARQAAEQQADLQRKNLGITRERKLAQNKFQREVDEIEFSLAQEAARTKATLAQMGVSVNSGLAASIDSSFQRQAEKAVLAYNERLLNTERAASRASIENAKRIQRIETLAEEETAYTKFRSDILRQETDIQTTMLGLEADNLARQADYMVWNARAIEKTGDIEARILEFGGELRAQSAMQIASAQAAAARSQGFAGFVSGMGGAATSIGRGVTQAKLSGKDTFLGFKI